MVSPLVSLYNRMTAAERDNLIDVLACTWSDVRPSAKKEIELIPGLTAAISVRQEKLKKQGFIK